MKRIIQSIGTVAITSAFALSAMTAMAQVNAGASVNGLLDGVASDSSATGSVNAAINNNSSVNAGVNVNANANTM